MVVRTSTSSMFVNHSLFECAFFESIFFVDPNEADKQELMEKTKMSLSQITVWFTNARVKMRKENKLPLNLYAKKKKKKTQDDSFHLDDTLSPPFAGQNLSFNGKDQFRDYFSKEFHLVLMRIELSTSFDNEYTSDGNADETFTSNIVMVCPSIEKQFVLAYSCLNIDQIVSENESRRSWISIFDCREKFIVLLRYIPIRLFCPIVLMIVRRI